MKRTAILLIDCPDAKGIVATVSEFLWRRNANILHADQHQDAESGLFLMRVEWDLADFDLGRDELTREFQPIAERFQMRWRLELSERPLKVALFASRHDHCLVNLLYRHQSGELACKIPLVVSNHPDVKHWTDFYKVPFHHFTVNKDTKAAVEPEQLKLLQEHDIDLIVLARYMQILTDDFVNHYPHQIINIQHSFLPAFRGARPYHRAFQRGVKLIGATSHYVTADLDEGPIIEQDVARVSHRDGLDELLQKGRDLEKAVLSRAVRWHLDHRILLYEQKTVVFD